MEIYIYIYIKLSAPMLIKKERETKIYIIYIKWRDMVYGKEKTFFFLKSFITYGSALNYSFLSLD